MKSVCLVSLGCPKNLVDSEVMLGLLSEEGYLLTTDPSEAEILIINTCAFIEEATREAVETILRYLPYKKEGRCRFFVVSGCLPQRYGKILEKELPDVDLFVGTGDFQRLPLLLNRRTGRMSRNESERLSYRHCRTDTANTANTNKRKSFLSRPSFLYTEATPRVLSTPPFMAYLKIAEGCSNACTFCTVPKIRGPYRSRKLRSVVDEAGRLSDQGVRELILIGQDTTAYGEDLRNGTDLERLLRELVKVEGLRWIRMLYAYPRKRYFTKRLLEWMAQERKLCPYFDLPIQHIDDRILRRMGRRSKGEEIRDLLWKIRAFLPEASLRSSLIVGFPGEGEKEFGALLEFVKEVEFDHLGAFKYSPEEGTPASRLPGQVPESIKEERLKRLMNLQRKISLKAHREMVGKSLEVLVEGTGIHGGLQGRLQTQAPEIDGCVYLKGKAAPGDWVEASITHATSYDLIGKIQRILP